MASSDIQVANGNVINPLDPDPEQINIFDIAHALSNQCRFSGHTRRFYSVAQHCVLVSRTVPEKDKLWGLLHDASEAYLVDIPSPLKNDLFGEQYREVEGRLMGAICEKFGLDPEMPPSVKVADNSLLGTEVRDLLDEVKDEEARKTLWDPWLFAPTLPNRIVPLFPIDAETQYLTAFNELSNG